MDSLTATLLAAREAHMSYMQYVSKFGVVDVEKKSGKKPIKRCPMCGKPLQNDRNKYCSPECRYDGFLRNSKIGKEAQGG